MNRSSKIVYDSDDNECTYNDTKSEPKIKTYDSDDELEFEDEVKTTTIETKKSKRKTLVIKKVKHDETDNKLTQSCQNCQINNELLFLVRDLSTKLDYIENELKELKQTMKKKSIAADIPPINKKNVIDWLNNYIVPTMSFDEFIENLNVNMSHFEFLLDYKLTDTIQRIIQANIMKNKDVIYPLYSTIEKSGKVYVFNEDDTWEVITIEHLSKFVKKIENKLYKHCIEWKNCNDGSTNFNSELQDKCQQATLKLSNVSYTQDCMMNRVRYDLCAHLKSVCKQV